MRGMHLKTCLLIMLSMPALGSPSLDPKLRSKLGVLEVIDKPPLRLPTQPLSLRPNKQPWGGAEVW